VRWWVNFSAKRSGGQRGKRKGERGDGDFHLGGEEGKCARQGEKLSCLSGFWEDSQDRERPGYEGLSPEICKTGGGEMKFNEEADSCLFQSLWRRN
jgi:hypothetical protein